ncbi:MAG: filamentous hemagglutinin family protein, partial [Betaproteobacteria bacterium]|nr:filamentous hemagglutinin family protein [Betaproteobacteria bacterium]
GGNINAGLPGAAGSSNIGIYTQTGGGIRVFTQNDFLVNSSKVVTELGGDILAYTSYGSIDAGRGAKTSVISGQWTVQTNPVTNQLIFIPPSNVSGSGLRTVSFDPDGPGPLLPPTPGSIFLFAPRGTVNAGEAGISSAGNVYIVALQVLNATNITAQGSTTGVPAAQSGSIAAGLAGASSAAASATQSATQGLGAAAPTFRPSFITVRVLGFGE